VNCRQSYCGGICLRLFLTQILDIGLTAKPLEFCFAKLWAITEGFRLAPVFVSKKSRQLLSSLRFDINSDL